MGKKQHQSDKLYITHKEWSTLFGGKRANTGPAKFRRLPFNYCALSLQPFEHPVCNKEGVIYDLTHIIPFLKRHGVDPASGEKMSPKDLTRLHFAKNGDGDYHCPVSLKVFNEHSHIVAIATTGNVFSHESVKEFNLKPRFLRDLVTDVPFERKDVITLQDPMNPEGNNLSRLHHLKAGLTMQTEAERQAELQDPQTYLRGGNSGETQAVMAELAATEASWKTGPALHSSEQSTAKAAPGDAEHTAHFSTGEAAASFTSTHFTPRTTNTAGTLEDDVVRYARVKKKGYVRLVTTLGDLNLELHAEYAPKTCENFLLHCASGYYKGTRFHRSIRNFMIQGGDPTGTGRGGESAFEGGKPFKDEFVRHLSHSGRGILSMANSGPNSNKAQFFITFRSCTHLDRKHSVFGRVVGGMDVLKALEAVPTDAKDVPRKELRILETHVFVDPFKEAEEATAAAAHKRKAAAQAAAEEAGQGEARPTVYRSGVGKYLSSPKPAARSQQDEAAGGVAPKASQSKAKKAKTKGASFGDFSSW